MNFRPGYLVWNRQKIDFYNSPLLGYPYIYIFICFRLFAATTATAATAAATGAT